VTFEFHFQLAPLEALAMVTSLRPGLRHFCTKNELIQDVGYSISELYKYTKTNKSCSNFKWAIIGYEYWAFRLIQSKAQVDEHIKNT
jgi:hypothetical protein